MNNDPTSPRHRNVRPSSTVGHIEFDHEFNLLTLHPENPEVNEQPIKVILSKSGLQSYVENCNKVYGMLSTYRGGKVARNARKTRKQSRKKY